MNSVHHTVNMFIYCTVYSLRKIKIQYVFHRRCMMYTVQCASSDVVDTEACTPHCLPPPHHLPLSLSYLLGIVILSVAHHIECIIMRRSVLIFGKSLKRHVTHSKPVTFLCVNVCVCGLYKPNWQRHHFSKTDDRMFSSFLRLIFFFALPLLCIR